MRTLVIYDDAEFGALFGGFAVKELSGDYLFAQHLEDASAALRRHGTAGFALIICRCNVPLDKHTPIDMDRSAPISIEYLRRNFPDGTLPPCIFLAAQPSARCFEALEGMPNARLLPIMDVARALPAAIRELVKGEVNAKQGRHHILDVDITLTGTGTGSCWHLHGKNGEGKEEGGIISIPPDDLDTLLFHSELVGATRADSQGLAGELIRRLGRDIYRCILEDSARCEGLGEQICTRSSGWDQIEALRFRFQVDDRTSHLLVETMARPVRGSKQKEDLWMLRSPIFRRFCSRSDRLPLYKDRASRENGVRCLVIQGCTDEFAAPSGGRVSRYPALSHAGDEVDWIKGYLTQNSEKFGLATVEVLRHSDHPDGGFGQLVLQALEQGGWQLIHYTGHSDFARDGEGYLVMGPDPGDILSVDQFGRAANMAQFVFLNSCLSAHPRFVMKLLERNIPAVAGYAWPIPDDVARSFSEAFYAELFQDLPAPSAQRGFLEYAHMRAKAKLHQANPSNSIWTAPLLFMQSMECQLPN
ncbi:CHAT domain-containing protein [Massilia sp. CF038]|uniref:CHAT domain-containing protein n=1 Tax=Massilia sp. CF038 TaxID=1881045 RepID=UPI00091C5DA2|nr:CHAT domain-containing protein [Massilia sp. CF038]SHG76674.1 CHAT domain-containing protein [Massilia sp. CF038]